MVRLNSKLKTVIDYMAGNASRKDEAPEPCVLIGYPSRKDEPILPSRNFPDKSFVDQACSLKMARYWPPSFSRFRFYRPGWTLSWSIKRQEQLA